MDLGIDIGTSEVKVALVDDAQRVVGQASAAVPISRPHPLWSEQNPNDWWTATQAALGTLRAQHPKEYAAARGIGLSGHMHGATLLDKDDRVLRPGILWNDGRSHAQCAELERRAPTSRTITGNIAMPGFTAPKLIWVEENEPEIFRKVARVLLPKDYVRLKLTGEAVSDMSDSAGTLWLDVARRAWSKAALPAATCALRWPPNSGWILRWWLPAAPATTPPAQPASAWRHRARPFSRWVLRACSSSPTPRSRRPRSGPCMPSATASPTPGTR